MGFYKNEYSKCIRDLVGTCVETDTARIAYPESNVFEDKIEDTSEYDPDQGERIVGKFPQCDNRWNDRACPKQRGEKIRCEDCENTKWTILARKLSKNAAPSIGIKTRFMSNDENSLLE